MNDLVKQIEHFDPCDEAVEWLSTKESWEQAWSECDRGDWMLWLIGKMSGPTESKSRKRLVLCACECARLALKHVPSDELRPLKAIETAESWASSGDATIGDVRTASDAAAAADAAASAAYAHAAAAASAAYAAAAADAAASDAAAAAAAAASAAYAAARNETLKKCADIVRRHYPDAPSFL